jgi:hypothetical protein
VSRYTVPEPASGPVVVAGSVLVGKSASGTLWGADVTGVQGCSGSPVVCQPKWTAATNQGDTWVTAHGPVVLATYSPTAGGPEQIAAFDSSAQTACVGSPKVCSPLWLTDGTATSGATVSGDLLYVTESDQLKVYDANGQQGCAGSPKRCTPLWTAAVTGAAGQPAIANGHVYVTSAQGFSAFDAAGSQGCAGVPLVCQPQWRTTLATPPIAIAATTASVVTVRAATAGSGAVLEVSDANGATNCAAGTCQPIWSAALEPIVGRPALANGRVLVEAGAVEANAMAFDEAGQTGCSAGLPRTCTPLWTRDEGLRPATPSADTTAAADVVYVERNLSGSPEPPSDLDVEALDQRTGAFRFALPANHGFEPPTVGDGRLFLVGDSGVEVFSL